MNAIDSRSYSALPSDQRDRPCHSIPRWACVYTHPQAERWATTNLRRQGYAPYLPLRLTRVRDNAIRSLWHTVERPLFPRYLFLPFDHLHESWSPIRATPGVIDLVRQGGNVCYARPGVLEALQAAVAEAATEPLGGSQWAPGMACALAVGSWAECPAVILKVEATMALVSLLMLGELREVAVQLDNLVPRDEN